MCSGVFSGMAAVVAAAITISTANRSSRQRVFRLIPVHAVFRNEPSLLQNESCMFLSKALRREALDLSRELRIYLCIIYDMSMLSHHPSIIVLRYR